MNKTLSYTLESILALPKEFRRNLINCLSGFKSASLVGTLNEQKITNLSVISSVFHVGATPPLVGMLMRPHSVPRHTLENIYTSGYYTINHVTEEFYPKAHYTSARFPAEESEFTGAGLTEVYSSLHPAPYVAEAGLRIGLAYKEKHTLMNETVLIVGQIVELLLPEEAVMEDGFVDLCVAGTLAISGLDSYHKVEAGKRLPYAKYKAH
ncbi:MAG: flavin reductase [Bacteroidota bacterium]